MFCIDFTPKIGKIVRQPYTIILNAPCKLLQDCLIPLFVAHIFFLLCCEIPKSLKTEIKIKLHRPHILYFQKQENIQTKSLLFVDIDKLKLSCLCVHLHPQSLFFQFLVLNDDFLGSQFLNEGLVAKMVVACVAHTEQRPFSTDRIVEIGRTV